ncbi:MAG: n-acetylglutamate synthase [Leadbetterella sp.]
MSTYKFHNKKFELVQNSETGQVNSDTVFEYKQEDNLVTADYYGGSIKYGKIIADLKGDELDMLYQCMTIDNQLKAGKAIAKISLTENGKINLRLNWQWLTNGNENGVSEYIEI